MTEIGKHTKSVPTIRERDIIPFGKYKGKVLLEVYAQDPDYVEWMVNNITNYSIDLYSGWKEFNHNKMFPEDEKRLEDYYLFPDDGVYFVSFWGNGFDYGLYRQKNGKVVKLFDWHSVVTPFAYYRIPEYSSDSLFWGKLIYKSAGELCAVGAYDNGTDIEYKEINGEDLFCDGTNTEDEKTYNIPCLRAVTNIPLLRY